MKIFVPVVISTVFNLYIQVEQAREIYKDDYSILVKNMPKDVNGATFVNSDGIQKLCKQHDDCYDMREPIYWCRLSGNQEWTEKGCYCDSVLKACIIERITHHGPATRTLDYAYCIPKNTWYCPDNIQG